MLTDTATYLGPATVEEIVGNRILLRLPDREGWAQLALSFPYEPRAGDVVLVIGEEDLFVIGVITGRGKSDFRVPGDLNLEAGGSVNISGSRGINLESPEISLTADRLEMTAKTVYERFIRGYRWVKSVFQTRAGRMRTIVDSQYNLRAGSISETAQRNVRIDGKQIHLG